MFLSPLSVLLEPHDECRRILQSPVRCTWHSAAAAGLFFCQRLPVFQFALCQSTTTKLSSEQHEKLLRPTSILVRRSSCLELTARTSATNYFNRPSQAFQSANICCCYPQAYLLIDWLYTSPLIAYVESGLYYCSKLLHKWRRLLYTCMD